MTNSSNFQINVGQDDNRSKYVPPSIVRLGTPAEICKEVKLQPSADGSNLTLDQVIDGEAVDPEPNGS